MGKAGRKRAAVRRQQALKGRQALCMFAAEQRPQLSRTSHKLRGRHKQHWPPGARPSQQLRDKLAALHTRHTAEDEWNACVEAAPPCSNGASSLPQRTWAGDVKL